MFAKLGAIASLLSFPMLCLYCLSNHSQMIQSTIQSAAQATLVTAPVPSAAATADGRDITLTGEVPSEDLKLKAAAAAALTPGVRSVDNRLRVIVPAAAVQTKLNDLLLKKKIEFETGKDVLLSSSTPVLSEALAILQTAPQLNITISGHTDGNGSATANRTLSQRRAQAVVDWFARNGVAASRMQAKGFGPDKPIAPNTTEEGRALNRRVEIVADKAVVVQERN